MTTYDEIYDLFTQVVDDYELKELYDVSPRDFQTYLQGFLMLAIAEFSKCKKDLSDRDDEEAHFNVTLTDVEKTILSKLMHKVWLKKRISNVTQIDNPLNDRDFKTHSAAQNLNAKKEYYNVVTEECDRMISEYGYSNADWLNNPTLQSW